MKRSVTIEDVAAAAGVSRALVSIVMRGVPGASDQNRRNVMQVAEQLGYRPDRRARLLGRNRSRTIGVTFGLHDETHAELVESLYAAAEASGYELVISPTAASRPEQQACRSLLEQRCEALILIGSSLAQRQLEALAVEVPVVMLTRRVTSDRVDVVRTDDVAGARLAVEHLVDHGHRRIAHLHAGRIAGAADRRRGYKTAMTAAGLASEIALVEGGRFEDDGWAAADRVLATGATAVFAYNDQSSAGLIGGLRQRRLDVPEALSVVGYDDSRLAHSPAFALTTIAQDSRALAVAALDLALARAEEPSRRATAIVVAPRLVVRATTERLR
jgi:DNA-binding LacI/PurR family transcriptional regulator